MLELGLYAFKVGEQLFVSQIARFLVVTKLLVVSLQFHYLGFSSS